jgi:FkbM family methyltransferase
LSLRGFLAIGFSPLLWIAKLEVAVYRGGMNRHSIPAPIRKVLRAGFNYQDRLKTWGQIARQIKGVTAKDQRAINRVLRRAPLTSLQNLSDWQDPVLVNDALVQIDGIGRFHVKGGTDQLYIVLPAREPEVISVLRERLKQGDTFVDAGANIGFFSILGARLVGPQGHVLAIEMMPALASTIALHAELNGCPQVEVIQAALSDRSGQIVDAWEVDGRPGVTSLIHHHASAHPVSVETRTLAEILEGHERIALMKMDIEKAELPALKGAGPSLQRVEAIVFEQLTGETEAGEYLASQGFEVSSIGGPTYLATQRG